MTAPFNRTAPDVRVWTAFGCAVAAGILSASPAWGEAVEGPEKVVLWVSSGTQAPVVLEQARDEVHIRVGRAMDLEGAPVYLVRTTLSPHPAYLMHSLGSVSAPTGAPVRSRMTSGFGMRYDPILGTLRLHSGVDLAAAMGSPIVAVKDGIVSRAGWNGGYGLYVSLEHGAGAQTRYGHMSRLNVVAGQSVRQGDVIGFVGSTGRSTGPHLHYETRINGQAVRPDLRGRTR